MRKTPKFGGVQACLCVDKSVDNVENPVDSFGKPRKYTKFRPLLTGFSAISTFFAAEYPAESQQVIHKGMRNWE